MPHTPSKNHPSSSSGSHLHLVKPPLSLRGSGRERVQQIAERCGGGRERHGTWLVCCPAHDDHHPSLVITPDDSKVLLYCRSQHCTAEAICTALGLTLGELFVSDRPTRQEPVASVPVPPRLPPDERNRGALSRRYVESCPLTAGDPVLTYLARRGIRLPREALPQTLRYHPHLVYRHDDGTFTTHPAMLARVDDAQGEAVTLHRTYLSGDGQKAALPQPKKLMTPVAEHATNGGAIRLYAAGDTLAVCEGVETGLAFHMMTGLPVWATVSAGGMERLVVPADVRLLVIGADHDPAGLEAARKLARRLLLDGKRVKIITPSRLGCDWADALQAQERNHG